MPIIIKEYQSFQEQSTLYITVEIPNVQPAKTDIYASKCYIKVHHPPHFFELDLAGEIDWRSSTAKVGDGKVVFTLKTIAEFKTIAYQGPDRLERRKKAEEERLQDLEKEKEEKRLEKRTREREMVKRQMKVEQTHRQEIQELKAKEYEQAKDILQQWVDSKEVQHTEEDLDLFESDKLEPVDGNDMCESSDDDIDVEAIRSRIKQQRNPVRPPPRQAQTTSVQLQFTSRGLIPTSTARETEDQKWLTRIKLAKMIKGEVNNNCQVLKQKGNEFFKLGDYESAVNAFTDAIKMDPTEISLYSNRSATLLKLAKYEECIQDCMQGLELIQREEDIIKDELKHDDGQSETRMKLKCKLLARLGTCYCNLGTMDKGLEKYQEACELDPQNVLLQKDLEALKGSMISV